MKVTIPNIPNSIYYERVLTLLNGETNFSPKQIKVLSIILEVFEGIYSEADEIPRSLVKHLKSEIREAVKSKIDIRPSFLSSIVNSLVEKSALDGNHNVTELYKRIIKSKLKGDFTINFSLQVIDDPILFESEVTVENLEDIVNNEIDQDESYS